MKLKILGGSWSQDFKSIQKAKYERLKVSSPYFLTFELFVFQSKHYYFNSKLKFEFDSNSIRIRFELDSNSIYPVLAYDMIC